jgi:hypothetical protein
MPNEAHGLWRKKILSMVNQISLSRKRIAKKFDGNSILLHADIEDFIVAVDQAVSRS